MLNITAIGNLTNDVVLRTREGEEQPYAILRVASNRRYRIPDGTRPTDFVSVKVRGKLAETCAKYGKKGMKVAVVGDLELTPVEEPERNPGVLIKAKTENYYLLTLAAIAKELEARGADANATAILAVGLPLTSFGREMNNFRRYLMQAEGPVSFFFEQKAYSITIADVKVFPQGYSAVLMQPEMLDEPSVIVADIGGWTVDLMQIDNRMTNAATCRSLELGMIRCIDEIAEQVRRSLGYTMTASQIESALRGDLERLDIRAHDIVKTEAEKHVRKILSAIQESGMDYRAMPTVFLGGGANLLKSHVPAGVGLCRPFIQEDEKLNAKGFERLCARLSEREKNG